MKLHSEYDPAARIEAESVGYAAVANLSRTERKPSWMCRGDWLPSTSALDEPTNCGLFKFFASVLS